MPSKKGQEQALNWLRSKSHDANQLDAINAELCINVIMDLQRQNDQLGARFGSLNSYRRRMEELETREKQISFFEDDGK